MTTLSVNVDHVATLRQARGTDYPDPVEAARIALEAGAAGITVHLRSDRRHIQQRDLTELRRNVAAKLNLEMATTAEMLAIALEIRPDQVTLVPERPEELTTEGGLDLLRHGKPTLVIAEALAAIGIAVSVFLDPDSEQIRWLVDHHGGVVTGFEINTDRYSSASTTAASAELEKIRAAASQGSEGGLEVYAGHGLTTENVGAVASIEQIEELNIGHYLVSRAVLVGLATAVGEMLEAIGETDGPSQAAVRVAR